MKRLKETVRPCFVAVIPILACIYNFNPALAGAICPPWISPEKPIATHHSGFSSSFRMKVRAVPLDYEITFKALGGYYRVPFGFMGNWVDKKIAESVREVEPSEIVDTSRIGFAFWMPSKRYPERNTAPSYLPGFHFCENGRPPPVDEFVVRAVLFSSSRTYRGHSALPSKQYERLMSSGIADWYLEERNAPTDFDLMAVRPDHPIRKIYYRHLPGGNPEVWFQCSGTHAQEEMPNPFCMSWVYFKGEDTLLYLNFSTRDLPKWRSMVEAARELIVSWRIASPKDPNPVSNK